MRKKNFHVYCTLIQIFEGMPNGGPQNREEKLWKITRELVIETHYCCCCLLKFLLPNELKNSPFLWVLPMKGKELQHSRNLVVDSSARDHNFSLIFKVEKILKGSLDSIPSPSPSVKIQIMGGKVCLRCKGKTLLGVVNKLLKTKTEWQKWNGTPVCWHTTA